MVGLLLVLTAGARTASADTITLNQSNGFDGPGPFGQVVTTLVGSSINVVVSMFDGFRMFGDFGFNVVDPDAGVAVTSVASVGGGPWSYVPGGVHLDGFGNFEFDIAGPAQGNSQTTQLSFTVSRTAGFTSASQLNELSTGGTPAFFATHASLNGNTGFVGGGGGPVVPEPATMSLFAAGLAFVGRAYRRRKQI